MESTSNGQTNQPGEGHSLILSPPVEQLLTALFSIVDDPFRPDLTMQHITSAVALQARNINRTSRPARTHEEWIDGMYRLSQQLYELNFTLEVLLVLVKNINTVSQERAKKNKK